MRDMYVRNGHGFVLVYSITSQATFNELNGYYDRIVTVKDVDTHVNKKRIDFIFYIYLELLGSTGNYSCGK
jgi:hypothetical protein